MQRWYQVMTKIGSQYATYGPPKPTYPEAVILARITALSCGHTVIAEVTHAFDKGETPVNVTVLE